LRYGFAGYESLNYFFFCREKFLAIKAFSDPVNHIRTGASFLHKYFPTAVAAESHGVAF